MVKQSSPTLEPAGPVRVWLGNRAAIEVLEDADAAAKMTAKELAGNGIPRVRRPIPVSKACSFYAVADGVRLLDAAREITGAFWPNVSDAETPAWVASTNPALAAILAEHWGGIEIRQPENPDEMHGPYRVDGKVS